MLQVSNELSKRFERLERVLLVTDRLVRHKFYVSKNLLNVLRVLKVFDWLLKNLSDRWHTFQINS